MVYSIAAEWQNSAAQICAGVAPLQGAGTQDDQVWHPAVSRCVRHIATFDNSTCAQNMLPQLYLAPSTLPVPYLLCSGGRHCWQSCRSSARLTIWREPPCAVVLRFEIATCKHTVCTRLSAGFKSLMQCLAAHPAQSSLQAAGQKYRTTKTSEVQGSGQLADQEGLFVVLAARCQHACSSWQWRW